MANMLFEVIAGNHFSRSSFVVGYQNTDSFNPKQVFSVIKNIGIAVSWHCR